MSEKKSTLDQDLYDARKAGDTMAEFAAYRREIARLEDDRSFWKALAEKLPEILSQEPSP